MTTLKYFVAALAAIVICSCQQAVRPTSSSDRPVKVATEPDGHETRIAQLELQLDIAREVLQTTRVRERALEDELAKAKDMLVRLTDESDRDTDVSQPDAHVEPAPRAEVTQAPTPKQAPPLSLPPYQYRYLTVELLALQPLSSGSLQATLKFSNTDATQKVALAHRAEGSGGIADIWKFFPNPIGGITDEFGNKYQLSSNSPLGFARDDKDWLILNPGEAVTNVFSFDARSRAPRGSSLSIAVDLYVVTRAGSDRQVTRPTIIFSDIHPSSE